MLAFAKNVVKKYFQIFCLRKKFSADVQIGQRHLFHFYQQQHQSGQIIPLSSTGFRVFSQFEEDGKILYILSVIGFKNYRFIEIGADDGLNSNCANLAFNFGCHGLFIDANPASISRGKYFYNRYPNKYGLKPVFCCSKVYTENINSLIQENGFAGKIELLSIDIDGNDYWIWDAIEAAHPRIVIIETHIIYHGMNVVVPYDPDYYFPGKHPQYHGASPIAMVNLGKKKGYRLIGANRLGFNFIFLRNDEGLIEFPEVAIEEVLSHPTCTLEPVDPYVLGLPFINP